jgi:hypothetical protein
MMDLNQLLNKIATPGDVAAAGIGFVLGLPLDYFLLHMAVPPGVVSGYSALGVFSLKKAVEAFLERFKKSQEAFRLERAHERESKELEEQRLQEAKELHERLNTKRWSVQSFFEQAKLPETAELIGKLYDMQRAEILTDEELDKLLKRIVESYRNALFERSTINLPARLELPAANVKTDEEVGQSGEHQISQGNTSVSS